MYKRNCSFSLEPLELSSIKSFLIQHFYPLPLPHLPIKVRKHLLNLQEASTPEKMAIAAILALPVGKIAREYMLSSEKDIKFVQHVH